MDIILSLLIFTLVSASGLLLYIWKSIPRDPLMFLIALGAGTMLSVSLVHIFPESLETAGENAIFAFLAGFLTLYILEEVLTPHRHDHKHGDHSHEDPHEHENHITIIAWLGIFIHTLLDGLSISAGFHMDKTFGFAILFGIMIHQLPVSLGLAGILSQSHIKKNTQIFLIILFACAGVIGYSIANVFLDGVSEHIIGLASAFAGGSLLYIATTDLMPVIHTGSRRKYLTLLFFLIGAVGMTLAHEFEHHEDHESMEHMSEDLHREE